MPVVTLEVCAWFGVQEGVLSVAGENRGDDEGGGGVGW